MMQETKQVQLVVENNAGERIDVWLAKQLIQLSRARIGKLTENGLVTVNDKSVKASYNVRVGDIVEVRLPPPSEIAIHPEAVPLDVLYEDPDIIVVNKPRGMVVHPAGGVYSGTLVNALLYHCHDLSGINGEVRPGIVHRIDKDTSGVLVAAKNDQAHAGLAQQLKDHSMKRLYTAIVHGNLTENTGTVRAPIGRHPVDRKRMAVVTRGGRDAVTHFTVLERFGQYSVLQLRLETGRTHQIRVHMAYIGHPVVCDPVYGPRKRAAFSIQGQALHAGTLGFVHPLNQQYLEYSAPLPDDMTTILQILRR